MVSEKLKNGRSTSLLSGGELEREAGEPQVIVNQESPT